MPRPVVERARQLLEQLEADGSDFEIKRPTPRSRGVKPGPGQMSLFTEDSPANPVIDALKKLRVDELSPIEALTKLYELKRLLGE
jgi:DNA mismatch repair protein MutS